MDASNHPSDEMNSLGTAIHKTIEITPFSQLRERLQILEAWFGSISSARAALSNSLVLELGCGQGDMTVTLAGLVGSGSLKILAVDPGSLEYGSPITLGQAQGHISNTALGDRIEWVQTESMEFITTLQGKERDDVPDYVILAHSLFYLPSEKYLVDLLTAVNNLSTTSGKSIKLLLAEWGMRASLPEAEAHVLAVRLQAKQRIADGNVQTVFEVEDLKRIAKEAGWGLEREGWFTPEADVDDGRWEVATARVMEQEGWRDEEKEVEEMEKAAKVERVRSMDVWGGVFGS